MESASRKAVHLQTLSRLVLLVVVPVGLGIFTWLFASTVQRRAEGVERTLRVQVALERLAMGIRTAEDSEQGYMLTGEKGFLATYQVSAQNAREQISLLAAMTADNPRQRDEIARVRPLLDARFSFLQLLIDKYAKGGIDIAAEQSPTAKTIQQVLDAMYSEEQRLLESREVTLAKARERFYWMFSIGYGLIVAIVASLYLSVRRYSLQSAAAEARLSNLNEQLEERVRDRTSLLKAREELLSTFVQRVPASVAMLDRDMRYVQASERWCADYGIERISCVGCSHYELFPDIPERWKEVHRRCLQGETLHSDEDRWEHDGRVNWLRWEVRPWGAKNGLPEGILVLAEDITARKEIEDALRETEATNRTLLDTASQAVLVVDAGGTIVQANRMVGEIFGYSPGELIGQSHEVLVPLALRERHRGQVALYGKNPRPRAMGNGIDLAGVRKDGTEFPIEVSLSAVETKRGLLAVSFVSDITARKQAEANLRESEQQLRDLAARLLTAQEEERRKLALELHDDVTQQLAFLSIELGKLASELPDSMKQPRGHIRTLQKQLSRASSEVRRISHGLHPSVITDFGLSIALEDFCQEFERAHGITVAFEGSADDDVLNDVEATCLYRIAQESMRNAALHGHATKLTVTLHAENDEMQLCVRDNGTGFAEDKARSKSSLGIVSMMERIRLVNGRLRLSPNADRGVALIAAVPLKEKHHGKSANSAG